MRRARTPATHAIVPASDATLAASGDAALTPEDVAEMADLVDESAAPRTREAYDEDIAHFRTWCAGRGFTPWPASPAVVGAYLKDLAFGKAPKSEHPGRRPRGIGSRWSVATIERRRSSIAQWHSLAGKPDPCDDTRVRRIMQGIRRRLGIAQREATPLLPEHILAALRALPEPRDVRDVRDVAIVTFGFATATRRSELADLDLADVALVPEGIDVRLGATALRPDRRTKTDQEGRGARIAVLAERGPADPVAAMRAWLKLRGNDPGPLFYGITRQGRIRRKRMPAARVGLVVKRFADLAGLGAGQWSAHSLRAGFVTAAHRAGVDLDTIMRQTRHRRAETTRRYLRDADRFRNNPGRGLLSSEEGE